MGTARSSQGLISSSDEYGFRSLGEFPEIGDIVEVHLRQTRKGRRGRPVTKCGRVTEIKPNDPTRVKMDTGPGKFRKVLRILTRHSTSMISNDTQSKSKHSFSQLKVHTDCFSCIVVEMYKFSLTYLMISLQSRCV